MARTLDIQAAETFIWKTARLIDRHRYSCLFNGAGPEPVVTALRPYQNPDGGFAHGLEPDGLGRVSQPIQVSTALHVLDEAGQFHDPMVMQAVNYLPSVTAPNGGVPAVLPTGEDDLSAPFVVGGTEGALLPTATIAGLLHKHRVEHPWLVRATDFCWQAITAMADTHPYEAEHCLVFLEHVPDRDRAAREAERLGRLVREQRLVALDLDAPGDARVAPGYGPGEYHTPLDYASSPTSPARRWFSDEEVAHDLDRLAAAQEDDGGWNFIWRQWNPATTLASRGAVSVRALTMLRANGRLPH
jgi:hypothetical protein